MRIEVLVEGASDEPVVREVLKRHFKLSEHRHFKVHPHRGRGQFPDPLQPQQLVHPGLLNQLARKLAAYGNSLTSEDWVLVLLDLDDDNCVDLLAQLKQLLRTLPNKPPNVLFRLAIEETESWFIADFEALKAAFPDRPLSKLKQKKIVPDAIVGAAERLAEHLGIKPDQLTGTQKRKWALQIAPHLDFDTPCSPSFSKFLSDIENQIALIAAQKTKSKK